ncbi:S-protein homolog 29-like [Lotus japonicus]|uniref:S-protein homolog 29-like n=1 Tax=Lotus japonicus TaxID=34305 RepID=UPI002588A413|nr:S-protein homolog 29-like [Lotus japonicus]
MLKVLGTVFLLMSIIVPDKFIVPVQSQQGGRDRWPWRKIVRVQNDLGNGVTLYVHCRSKDDDLGEHYLSNGQYQEWSFGISWIGSTLFWCNVGWNDVKHSFEAYNNGRDYLLCGSQCWRSIKPDGAYFYLERKGHRWVKQYEW